MKNIDYRGLAALDAVISLGGFDKAAAALALSQPAVSHRIRALEEDAGTLLVIRSQPPQATPFGQRLVAHYRQVRLLEASLASEASPADGAETLPQIALAVNADSVATWFPSAMESLLAAPAALFEIRIADQDQTLRQLREGRVFACVANSEERIAGTERVALGSMRYICLASPAFAARWFPDGLTVAAARRAPGVRFDQDDLLHQRYLAHRLGYTDSFPHHLVGSAEGFVRFVESGFAYGMAPYMQVREMLAAGRVVDITPGDGLDVPLAWYSWNIRTPLTEVLSECVIRTAAAWLQPPSS
ncbi:LysR family transcriptional regulator ArgP [Oxalobacteraceae bacterium]|nr:LysR family transcriptional regulator ArgP [Oxalobacteraceae bacterium]